MTPGTIKAALLFVPEMDIRAYLRGACIEHSSAGTRMVATDGHRLICIRINETPIEGDPVRYIVARSVLESVVMGFSKAPSIRRRGLLACRRDR